jgi:cell division protein FtsB
VRSKKRKFWKFALLILCFLAPLLAWLGFGDHGLIHLYRKDMERQACVETIRQLAEENQSMLEEIRRLRTDMEYIESVARKELNLIKQNEIVYRFDKKSNHDNTVKTIQSKTQQTDTSGISEREVQGDGETK